MKIHKIKEEIIIVFVIVFTHPLSDIISNETKWVSAIELYSYKVVILLTIV